MDFQLNGQPAQADGPLTLADLLARHDLTPQRVAIEVNEVLVRRADFAATPVEPGDRVEIVTLVGGG